MVKLLKERKKSRSHFSINDHQDILIEVLQRLDERSLAAATCVCRLWCSVATNESLWESLCFCHVSPPPAEIRPVVAALGGYRRLYVGCLRPVLSRLVDQVRTRDHVQLSLSLFCVDFYERLGGRLSGVASSLMFLCDPVVKVGSS
ncbi:hypothetical protein Syun_009598 [Stephania yunnanensis]|uniref:F-box domain-containing protein n=1 Tax=Stephania yunnanensis TaxID=152371 RepID=A0AAP0KGZ2_9MAGN